IAAVRRLPLLTFSILLPSIFLFSGCRTSQYGGSSYTPPVSTASAQSFADQSAFGMPDQTADTQIHAEIMVLREGDNLRVTFPGSPNLDTTQEIRRDGKITMPLIGEVQAAGMTPEDLQQDLIKRYAPQLSTSQITVTLLSSAFPVYVTGCVLHPGKILSNQPMTALEAVMEAGGFDYTTANMKSVRVIRNENGATKYYRINLKNRLDGSDTTQFYLKPSDIVYVPERFSLF
ncbi:MAG: polysaccharide biosynthesis/export family protein, partial [Limisphaerales bacterium]